MPNLLPKQSILVVDDTPDNIDLLTDVLCDDYRIRVATSGEKALKIVYSDEPPDLILLDIMMPGLSGLEICRRLKANPDRRRIPIIFVTAMTSVEDEERGLALGAVDYITKPISPPIVRARVRTHLALYDQSRELERMVRQRTEELLTTRQQIIRRLGRAAEFKDNETGNHVLRMSHYARLIASAHGLGEEAANIIFNTAPMHDIGKIGIPDSILLKPGRLDAEEWKVMHQHPIMGAEIIGKHENELLESARIIALSHHEKWDGSGYPRGLKGEDIPLEGRIVAIADVFDALLSQRPYKSAFSVERSLELMDAENGRHFDPQLLAAFRRALPEILRVKDIYADEYGALTDLEFQIKEIYTHQDAPEGYPDVLLSDRKTE
ncbi:HD-GYP domain-containing protein [Dechloromonas denitrificans]|uniref:HD-GYP domain-containing protein n=1 Tax=Dechloromonas denitrificans TaxID=281362 RepID=UPI001CF8022C|nr:two-component system response regulator [Dechloromonas denitrificans]UCV03710.1 two-component system response regulator [Dechloromonas denitrificans]UCV07971.1 two-component system response regulator [Dechloromonas denitrificans]